MGTGNESDKKKILFQDGEGERAECFTMCVCLRPPGGLKLTLGKDVQASNLGSADFSRFD